MRFVFSYPLHFAPRRPQRVGVGALLTFCGVFLTLGGAAFADITLTPEKKNGDKVSDVATVTVRAESPDGIDKVEFKIDDREPVADSSTPYELEWDTIKDTEGAHTITITAYDANGKTKRITLSLVVDNELNQGAASLAQKGQDALKAKNYDEALKYSRRALKAEPDSLEGARVAAAVYAQRLDWNRAISVMGKAKGLDENAPGLLELAGYRLRRALLPDNAAAFFTELAEITDLRRKAANLHVKDVTAQNADNHQAIGDSLLNAGRFHDAAVEYGKSALEENAPIALVNRLALAQSMDGDAAEAIRLLRPVLTGKKDDAATRAVYGLALLRTRRFEDARNAVENDLADHVPAALVIAAYADVMSERRPKARPNAQEAVSRAPQAGDAYYAFSMATNEANESESALYKAMELSPFQTGPYLDYATRVLTRRRSDRYEQALNLTDLVLKTDPENVNAQLMQALIYLQTKRISDAETLLRGLTDKHGSDPDVLMALAVYWQVKGNSANTRRYLLKAREADRDRFYREDVEEPIPYLLTLNRKLHYRADPFLTLASLYPTGGTATKGTASASSQQNSN